MGVVVAGVMGVVVEEGTVEEVEEEMVEGEGEGRGEGGRRRTSRSGLDRPPPIALQTRTNR
jgi:hypothetical protein